MKTKYFLLAIVIFYVSSCLQHVKRENEHFVRVDFRFGSKFYSLCSKETGESFALKGISSDYNDTFRIFSSDTSQPFKLNLMEAFLKRMKNIRSGPMVIDHNSDAPRVEIYYDDQKIYDSHKWDELFWDTFRPVILQMPSGFNPFLADEKPFG